MWTDMLSIVSATLAHGGHTYSVRFFDLCHLLNRGGAYNIRQT